MKTVQGGQAQAVNAADDAASIRPQSIMRWALAKTLELDEQAVEEHDPRPSRSKYLRTKPARE